LPSAVDHDQAVAIAVERDAADRPGLPARLAASALSGAVAPDFVIDVEVRSAHVADADCLRRPTRETRSARRDTRRHGRCRPAMLQAAQVEIVGEGALAELDVAPGGIFNAPRLAQTN
jgi:hypothetical protein